MSFLVATNATSLPVGRPNANRLELRTLVPKIFEKMVEGLKLKYLKINWVNIHPFFV